MFKIHNQQRGATLFWLIVIVAVIVWGMTMFTSKLTTDSSNEEITTEVQSSSPDNVIVKSFTTVNGYDTSRGKAVITEDKFGNFDVSVAAVMPSEFPGTYYQSKIVGGGGEADVILGKMTKTGGSFVSKYVFTKSIDSYSRIVIWVDGEAETVEGKTIPHDIMVLDL